MIKTEYAKQKRMMRVFADMPYTVNTARVAAERASDLARDQCRKQLQELRDE